MPRRTARRAAAAAAEGVDADKDEGRGPVASPGFVWIFVHLAGWLKSPITLKGQVKMSPCTN